MSDQTIAAKPDMTYNTLNGDGAGRGRQKECEEPESRASLLSHEEVIDLLYREQAYVASEFGVKRLGVFGSVAIGRAGVDRDIDIIVEFKHPLGFRFFDLIDYLEFIGNGEGVHRPGVDEDISAMGILSGSPAPHPTGMNGARNQVGMIRAHRIVLY